MNEKCICGYFYKDGYSEKKGKVVTLFGDEEFIFVENLMIPSPPNSEGSGLIRVDFYRCPKCETLKVDTCSLDRLHYLISLQKEITDDLKVRNYAYDKDRNTYLINFKNIIEKNGKTIYENNMDKKHKFPIGSLVEYEDGMRLFVKAHTRDCDGTPLYSLGEKSEDRRDHWIHGYNEKYLTLIKEEAQDD
jgi:hypothetical protein